MLKIIDLSQIEKSSINTVNQSFEIWREVYTPILEAAGEVMRPEMFWKCKLLSVIERDGRVEGFMLSCIYDLSLIGLIDIPYFAPLSSEMKAKLVDDEEKVFTCEWVTVNPSLRGRFSKVQIGDVVMGLGFKAFTESPCTLAMGFSRTDLKADKMAESFGFEKKGMIYRHGIECGIMMMRKADFKPHKYAKTQEAIEDLYKNKELKTNLILEKV